MSESAPETLRVRTKVTGPTSDADIFYFPTINFMLNKKNGMACRVTLAVWLIGMP